MSILNNILQYNCRNLRIIKNEARKMAGKERGLKNSLEKLNILNN